MEVVTASTIVTRIVMWVRERRTAVLIVVMAGVVKWLLDRKSNNFLILNSLMRPKFHHFWRPHSPSCHRIEYCESWNLSWKFLRKSHWWLAVTLLIREKCFSDWLVDLYKIQTRWLIGRRTVWWMRNDQWLEWVGLITETCSSTGYIAANTGLSVLLQASFAVSRV